MVLLVSVLAENWLQVRRSLLRGGRPPPGTSGSRTALPESVLAGLGGRLLRIDWAAQRITHHLPLPSPAGSCWSDDDRTLWVASGRGSSLCVVTPHTGRERGRVTLPGFHDLHSVTRLDSRLLVSSAGTDAVFELDLEGRLTREWWGTEHGLSATPTGSERVLDPSADHRGAAYPSLGRAVHPNGAVALADGRWRVTSFHQGAVLDVHPNGRWTRWATGLDHPHGLHRLPDGAMPGACWGIADTLRGRVLGLDGDGRIVGVLADGLQWVQDATWSPEGLVVLDDLHVSPGMRPEVGNCVLTPATGVRCVLPASWRLVSVSVLTDAQADATAGWPSYPQAAAQRWSVAPV